MSMSVAKFILVFKVNFYSFLEVLVLKGLSEFLGVKDVPEIEG